MLLMSVLTLILTLLPVLSEAKSFPATPDATAADQQRWGSTVRGYIAEGCWHPTSATTTATIASCRAFALEHDDPPRLVGFSEDTPRAVTYSGGDGTYWLAGRATPALTPAGWTCLPGVHYCWIKSAAPPGPVSGLAFLGQTTIVNGSITDFLILGPWRRTTPYVVPAAVTLRFGVCPEAGRWQIFDANEETTGTVRFAGSPCGVLYPEWWGVDPTGVVDSTATWRDVIAAATSFEAGTLIPIQCEGVYAISAPTAGTWAIEITNHLQLQGTFRKGNHPVAPDIYPCRFNFTGLGSAFYAPPLAQQQTYGDLRFERFAIIDLDDTGEYGFYCDRCSIYLHDVSVQRFNTGFNFLNAFYYGEAHQIKSRLPRSKCANWSDSVNGAYVDIQCAAQNKTGLSMAGVVSIAGTDEDGPGFSAGARINIIAEVGSGLPVFVHRVRGLSGHIYVETPGACAHFHQDGVVQLGRIDGGNLHLRLTSSCTGWPPRLPVGLRIFDNPHGPTYANFKNLTISGNIPERPSGFEEPVRIDSGPGIWGAYLAGLSLGNDKTFRTGHYTTGTRIGENYLTHGAEPLFDEGRGDSLYASWWKQGDIVYQSATINPSVLTNRQIITTVPGNPPGKARTWWPTTDTLPAPPDAATPSVQKDQIAMSHLSLQGSATPVTDFLDGVPGQCVTIRANGPVTVVNSVQEIVLMNNVNYAMNAQDTLQVCYNNGTWYEVGRGDNR